jgi:hypothetical protein
LRKTLHKKGLVEWLKVKALSSNPSTAKQQLNQKVGPGANPLKMPVDDCTCERHISGSKPFQITDACSDCHKKGSLETDSGGPRPGYF